MSEIVIVSGARTPMGGFQGSLSSVPAVDLGALAIREAVQRAGIEAAGGMMTIRVWLILQGSSGE